MNTDMSLVDRWPQAVHLTTEVRYEHSAPERSSYRLAPCVDPSQVRVLLPRLAGEPVELRRLHWKHLPGATLYLRCLNVLAWHLFGSVEMVPRVQGAPLWSQVSLGMWSDDNDLHQLTFDVQVVDDRHAVLRYRCRRNQPLVTRSIDLDVRDADPLRALLRVGATCVKTRIASHAEAPAQRHAIPVAVPAGSSSAMVQHV